VGRQFHANALQKVGSYEVVKRKHGREQFDHCDGPIAAGMGRSFHAF
jgi:hypothetical protein